MSEMEALEYRIAKLHAYLHMVLGVVLMTMALVLVLLFGLANTMPAAVLTAAATVITAAGAVVVMGASYADKYDGIWRQLFNRAGIIGEDPPLTEWCESLENRNAFPVDGDD